MSLRRFWIQFKENHGPSPLGFGVTAFDESDAISLLRDAGILAGAALALIAKIESDVDVSMLDQNHVLPNMHSPDRRGIWFPIGFR